MWADACFIWMIQFQKIFVSMMLAWQSLLIFLDMAEQLQSWRYSYSAAKIECRDENFGLTPGWCLRSSIRCLGVESFDQGKREHERCWCPEIWATGIPGRVSKLIHHEQTRCPPVFSHFWNQPYTDFGYMYVYTHVYIIYIYMI